MSNSTDMICEAHPDLPWPHDDCAGPGMPPPEITPAAGEWRYDDSLWVYREEKPSEGRAQVLGQFSFHAASIADAVAACYYLNRLEADHAALEVAREHATEAWKQNRVLEAAIETLRAKAALLDEAIAGPYPWTEEDLPVWVRDRYAALSTPTGGA